MTHDLYNTRQTFKTGNGSDGVFYSLPQLEKEGLGNISRLPISIRIVLESVLRNFDGGKKVSEANVRELAAWQANSERTEEIPFVVARVILQDFTGVPLLVDLAAMRSAVQRMGKDPGVIEPLVPVDLVIDHSVQVDYAGSEASYQRNMEMEFKRNDQRYRFLKWGTQAFNGFGVAREIHLHRVIHHQIDRHERLDDLRVLPHARDRRAHRREIDEQRHAGEILQHHARDD